MDYWPEIEKVRQPIDVLHEFKEALDERGYPLTTKIERGESFILLLADRQGLQEALITLRTDPGRLWPCSLITDNGISEYKDAASLKDAISKHTHSLEVREKLFRLAGSGLGVTA